MRGGSGGAGRGRRGRYAALVQAAEDSGRARFARRSGGGGACARR